MKTPLYLQDSYLGTAKATVAAHADDGGLILDQSLFYPNSGGQPGDAGQLVWPSGTLAILDTAKGPEGIPVLRPEPGSPLPAVGTSVEQRIDWDRRYDHMRMHTALHLLSVVLPRPVTGGAISWGKGRLDLDMTEAPQDKEALQIALQAMVDRDLPVTDTTISEAELDANPGLVKTLSVSPPRGAGRIRLVRIGQGADQVDLQPCGGTHVARTGEIGILRVGKIEKKGHQNRRVYLHLDA